jgi:ADP-ribose pyrophosphatase YjhB (NUDIX family)
MNIQRPKSKQPIPNNAKRVFKGVIFDVYQWEQEMFDGTTATFEKLKRPDTVTVFPVLPDGRIVLTKQEQPSRVPFIAATGGRVDEGEDILSAAKRELLEESGYEAEDLILWDARQPVTKIEWAVYIFIAKGIKKVAELHTDVGEKIEPYIVTFEELVEIASDKDFYEEEVRTEFMEAKINPKKMQELRKLFKP